VIGGSIVGSTVGALLARRFDRVTILERDSVPREPAARAGVPQARHVHALLARGAAELEGIFPGLVGEMVDNGAQLVDVGRDMAWLTAAGWGVPFESRIMLCCATRDFIEWYTRRRALEAPNITMVDGVAVAGLLTDPSGERVVGVRVRQRGADPSSAQRGLQADLVVDATGRASQLPAWLEEIGRRAVRETVVDAGMKYASRFYAVPEADLRGWQAAYVQPALPEHRRGGILFPVEGNRFHLTLIAYGDPAPPTDEAGFRAFAESLRHPILADILRHAEPLSPVVMHRRTENRWRHFDEVDRWPEGLVALGDSFCCFDPVYGQGMSTGILGALTLARRFDTEWTRPERPAGFSRRAQRALVSVVRPAWNLSTGEDLRLPSTTGGQLRFQDRLLQRYIDSVIAAATVDPRVRGRLLSVMNMLTGPETLLHPKVIGRLVRYICSRDSRPPLWSAGRASVQPEDECAAASAFVAG
jgi:2-polyprenyl-6-methoxyphenol hydroxylase-like FAD-dependent oxidoreductase